MEYISKTAYAPTVATAYTPFPQPTNDQQIQRSRKILIIILGVLLGLSLVTLVSAIFGSGVPTDSEKAQRGPKIAQTVLLILLYGFGIFVAHRYSTLGLRIFAWLNIIGVVLIGIVVIFLIVVGIMDLSDIPNSDNQEVKKALTVATLAVLFTTGLCIAAIILGVIIIKLAFKLAGLIDANKNTIIQQS